MAEQGLDDKAHKKAISNQYDYGGKAHKQFHDLLTLIYGHDSNFVHQYLNKVYSKANVKKRSTARKLEWLTSAAISSKILYASFLCFFQY